jgi:RNA polymerase primary sigma factor
VKSGAKNRPGGREIRTSGEIHRPRRGFSFGANAARRAESQPYKTLNHGAKAGPAHPGKAARAGSDFNPVVGGASPAADLAETIKPLLHLAREQGQITYDDINDLLPDGVSPDNLDALYTKLQNLGVEVVAHLDVKQTKPEEPEPEEDFRPDSLDDPVQMYMNQMGKVPLLTREQEIEVCQRIEAAESEMKRLVYSLGFTAKEHSAIAEKLLADPPKERFDRIVVDKKVASREGHLRHLLRLIKKVQALDALVDEQFNQWQKVASPARRAKLFTSFISSCLKFTLLVLVLVAERQILHDAIKVGWPQERCISQSPPAFGILV